MKAGNSALYVLKLTRIRCNYLVTFKIRVRKGESEINMREKVSQLNPLPRISLSEDE